VPPQLWPGQMAGGGIRYMLGRYLRFCIDIHCMPMPSPIPTQKRTYEPLFHGLHSTLLFLCAHDDCTCSREASIQTSSFLGHTSHPFIMMFLAVCIRPVTSSSRAAAIHPGVRGQVTKCNSISTGQVLRSTTLLRRSEVTGQRSLTWSMFRVGTGDRLEQ